MWGRGGSGLRDNDVWPGWFLAYVGMEEAAKSIRVYETSCIPGLLQTEEYATAVVSLGELPASRPSGSSCCGRSGSAGSARAG